MTATEWRTGGFGKPVDHRTISWRGRTAHFINLSDRPRSTGLVQLTDPTLCATTHAAKISRFFAEVQPDLIIMLDTKEHLRLQCKAFGVFLTPDRFWDPKVAD